MFWGGSGYPTLWNEAPFLNNQDLFIIKDDYTKVFGKHFVKAGVLASFNKKNEDTMGNGSQQALGLLGFDGHGAGRYHRQHPGRFPAPRHDVRLLRGVGQPFGAAALARRRDVRGRLVAGIAPGHLRLRRALLAALQPVHDRRQDHELRAVALQPGARQRSRATACSSRPAATGARTPAPAAVPTDRTAR